MDKPLNIKCVIIGDSNSGKFFVFDRIRNNIKGNINIDVCKHKCKIHSNYDMVDYCFVKMKFSDTY